MVGDDSGTITGPEWHCGSGDGGVGPGSVARFGTRAGPTTSPSMASLAPSLWVAGVQIRTTQCQGGRGLAPRVPQGSAG